MITRIEIDGFKSFVNFSVNLKPFQILIGANGVGKSNLFDAIILLSDLARDNTVYDAFRRSRGEVWELFTANPDGSRATQMKFAVEMLIDPTISDDFGVQSEVSSTRLRYELHIERQEGNGLGRLYVVHESLDPIVGKSDSWVNKLLFEADVQKRWVKRSKGRRGAYISTTGDELHKVIHKHQDGRSGKQQLATTGKVERSVLSTFTSAEFPTAYAVRQEMLNWHLLQFNPAQLHAPSSIYAPPRLLPDGSNLATVLERMNRDDEYALADLSIQMANLVPGILKVSVETLKERQVHLINATTTDGSTFSSQVLSDGTLRILALSVLDSDPQHHGVLCFEEPENGVHPQRLEPIVQLLRALSTDFSMPEHEMITPRLRQVIVNTHSPALLSCAAPEDFIFIYMTRQFAKSRMTQAAHVTNQLFEWDDPALRYVTKMQLEQYLKYKEPQSPAWVELSL